MSLLDLSESEVDPIIDHMLQFVKFANENRSLVFRDQGDKKDDKMASEFEMNNGLNPQPTVKSDELEPNRDSKAHHCKLEIPSSSLKSAIFGQVEKYAR